MTPNFSDDAMADRSLKSLDRLFSRFLASDLPIWSDPAYLATFLEAVDELVGALRAWSLMWADRSIRASISLADDLMQRAMFRLHEDFRSLMERSAQEFELGQRADSVVDSDDDFFDGEENDGGEQILVARPITDYNVVIDVFSSATINDLQEMVKRMVAAGYGDECARAYSICRRKYLEESMSRLRLQKLSIEEVHQLGWQDVEDEIERWIKAIKLSLRILFPSERRLCDRVFFGFTSAADLSFMDVCRGLTTQLLNFADAVAIGTRSPEKLFKVLDLFETIMDLMPDFEAVFCDQYCLVLRNEAIVISKRLGEAVRGILMELENLIRRDPPLRPSPVGGLHPITRYVMNYLRAACRSRWTLEQIFEDDSGVKNKDAGHLAAQILWILDLLESNLEAKAKIYEDAALSSVFMINNEGYILQKVNDSELFAIIGDSWVRKHKAKIRQYRSNYQRSSWNSLLDVLRLDDTYSTPDAAAVSMKEKLEAFNSGFDELCGRQSAWVVADEQLREELRISATKLLLPSYRVFIGRLKNLPGNGRLSDKYIIRYGVDDIKARLKELFKAGK